MRGISYALLEMERMNYGSAKYFLQQAQKEGEQAFDGIVDILLPLEDNKVDDKKRNDRLVIPLYFREMPAPAGNRFVPWQ